MALLKEIIEETKLTKAADAYLQEASELSVTVRQGPTQTFLFLLNHTNEPQQAKFLMKGTALLSKKDLHELTLAPMEVEILRFPPTESIRTL